MNPEEEGGELRRYLISSSSSDSQDEVEDEICRTSTPGGVNRGNFLIAGHGNLEVASLSEEEEQSLRLVTLIRLMRRCKRYAAWRVWLEFLERGKAWEIFSPKLVKGLEKITRRHSLHRAFERLKRRARDRLLVRQATEGLRIRLTEITKSHRFLLKMHAIHSMVGVFEAGVFRVYRKVLRKWQNFLKEQSDALNRKLIASYIIHRILAEAIARQRLKFCNATFQRWKILCLDSAPLSEALSRDSYFLINLGFCIIERIFASSRRAALSRAFYGLREWASTCSVRRRMLLGIKEAASLLDAEVLVGCAPTEDDAHMGQLVLVTALAGWLVSDEEGDTFTETETADTAEEEISIPSK